MPNAKDIQLTVDNINFFVAGGVGSGKSFFAATFPTPGFVFDFDKQITVYRGLDFDYAQYDMTSVGWLQYTKDLALITKDKKYKSLIIDSTTSLQAVAMERALAINPSRNEAGGVKFEVHYSLMRTLIEAELRKLLSYVGYKVVIAHMEADKDSEGSIIGYHPLLVGALKTIMPAFFGEILYAQRRNIDSKLSYVLQTVNQGYYNARSNLSGRQKLLPDFVPNDFNSIMELLKKKKEEEDIKKMIPVSTLNTKT